MNKSARMGKVRNDERAEWAGAWALFPGSIAYVWHGALHATTVAESLIREGFSSDRAAAKLTGLHQPFS